MPLEAARFGARLAAAAILALFALPCIDNALADDTAAHAIAEKFSGAAAAAKKEAAEKKRAAEAAAKKREAEALARQKAEEADMLAQAQREAAEREEEQKRAAAEAAQRAEEEARAEALRKVQAAADEARRAEEQRRAEEEHKAEEERQAKAAEAKRLEEQRQAEEDRLAEETRKAEAARRALEDEREEEARRLTAKMKRLEETRAAEHEAARKPAATAPATDPVPETATAPTQPPIATGTVAAEPRSGLGVEPPSDPGSRVTILLVMDPGTTGIRRWGQKTADAVLCSGARCWVGGGPAKSAIEMARGMALGPGNTLGKRAGGCNHSLVCIFRDVDLRGDGAVLQPIDLRIMRHDRRQELGVRADRTCRLDAGTLVCATLYRADSWRAWVIPESIAAKAGPDILRAAVQGGLTASRAASVRDAFER